MRFKNYLEEEQYRTETNARGAWALLNKHCKDALKDIETPIVRGMKGFYDGFGVLHGEVGGRKSRNTSNHYTVILDEVLPKEFPKRSASIICANWNNREHAKGYGGRLFAIIPFDGVKIGVCPYSDIWDTEIKVGGMSQTIQHWNKLLSGYGIGDKMSFNDMMAHLESKIKAQEFGHSWLKKLKPGTVKETFEAAYTKPFTLATTAESEKYKDHLHELWIGGKCVAINMQVYANMMKNPDPDAIGYDE